jgi:uncharacterized protein with HEPN domain
MTKGPDHAYLEQILDALTKIEHYTRSVDYDAFLEDTLIQDGVVRQIEVMLEAAKRLSQDLKNKHSSGIWRDITEMKSSLIHDFFSVDIDALWEIVEEEIPVFKQEIEKIIRSEIG